MIKRTPLYCPDFMPRPAILKNLLLAYLLILPFISRAQDSLSRSVDPKLMEIYNSRVPRTYTIAGISVTGTRSFDKNLIISISGMAVGDAVQIPGTDIFSKAISKLWKQNLVSFVKINLLRLDGSDLYVEIELVERPRLLNFSFSGIKKGEKDDLETKVGLSKDRVLTENMKLSAIEAIRKFYYDKGYRNVDINASEKIGRAHV